MESSGQNEKNSSDFEFKYIPKLAFDRILREVESSRKQLKEEDMWGDFCTITSELEKTNPIKKSCVKNITTKKDEKAIIQNYESDVDDSYFDRYTAVRGDDRFVMPSSDAPLFGPPRKLGASKTVEPINPKPKETHKKDKHEQNSNKLKCSSNVSIHMVDEIYESPRHHKDHQLHNNSIQNTQVADRKIKVSKLITTDDGVNDMKKSNGSASDNDETLYSDILDLCDEIENVNEEEVEEENDMIQGEIKDERNRMRNESNKCLTNKKELSAEVYATYIDDEFDFLQDEFENLSSNDDESGKAINVIQTQPAIGLRTKNYNRKIDEPVNKIPMTRPQAPQREMSRSEKIDENGNIVVMTAKEMIKIGRLPRMENVEATKALKARRERERAENRPDSKESLESIVELRRASGYQENICQYLERMFEILTNPPKINDIADLNKRKKRSNEFTNRFARNHLYQLGRSTEELRLMPDNPLDLATKVNSLFQIIMQAAQTYLKNIEMFIYNKNPDKLLVLVDFIINASKICFDRKVFDKKDVVVMKMLKKCAEVRGFLDVNRDSKAVNYEPLKRMKEQVYVDYDDYDDDFENHSNTKKYKMPRKLKNPYGMPKNSPALPKNLNNPSKNINKGSRLSSRSHYEVPRSRYDNPYDKPKNPYEAPSMRMKSKPSSLRSNLHSVRSTFVRTPPKNTRPAQANLKKSESQISTAVQKEIEQENDINIIPTVSEKPLENENGSSNEIMKMIQNITKEKFEEMFAPLLAQLVPKSDMKSCKDEEIKSSVSRVTADIQPLKKSIEEPKRPSSNETVHRYAHNVQYMFVKSENDDCATSDDDVKESEKMEPPKAIEPKTSIEPSSMSRTADNVSKTVDKVSKTIEEPSKIIERPSKTVKKPSTADKNTPKTVEKVDKKLAEEPQMDYDNSDCSDEDDSDYEEETEEQKNAISKLREEAIKERLEIFEKMSKNPLYGNDQIKEPWKVMSDLSDEILDELIEEVLQELEINDEEILESFLRHELAC